MTFRSARWRIAVAILVVTIAGLVWLRVGPVDERLLDEARHRSTTVVDRNGEVLYESLGLNGERGERLAPDRLPQQLVAATLAAEDRRFFSHPGIDPLAVARAAVHNFRAMRVIEGGSTITQQAAKLLLGSKERSLRQKWREAVLALRLEHRLDKREILALYLNQAPYGNRIRGAARASRAYFGVESAQLTSAQAAFLAALPQRPSAFNPLRDARKARPRQLAILEAMPLDDAARKLAREERLQFRSASQPVLAMHFVERVLAQSRGASRVETTLDAGLQREVVGIIAAQRDTLLRHGASSVAVAVLDNASGEWLAWEGSGDYFGTDFGGAIDGVVTPRQPGSTLKPFTYALAFESGYSPASVLADVPSHFPTAEEGVIYTPRNYDGQYRGPLLVRSALAGSENVPAVALLQKLGPESLLRLLRSAGFDTLDRTADYYGLGLTLGDAEVTLEQLVTAYAAFARGGFAVRPQMMSQSTGRRVDESTRSDVLPSVSEESGPVGGARARNFSQRSAARPDPSLTLGMTAGRSLLVDSSTRRLVDSPRLVDSRTAFWITDILSDPAAREYAFGTGGSLDFPFPVAVKTGTSQAYRDNWTIGYTRDVTVGVWVGNFDRTELRGSSGVTGAAPIFNAVMLAAVRRARGSLPIGDREPIVAASRVEEIEICTLSGARPSPWCPSRRTEWLPQGEPARFCSWHHDGAVDWPAEYRAWASVNAPSPQPQRTKHVERFAIANPPDGATYMIDPTLRREFQTLQLRAVTAGQVTWRVDGETVQSGEWPLEPGRHTVTAVDERGRRDEVRIYVK